MRHDLIMPSELFLKSEVQKVLAFLSMIKPFRTPQYFAETLRHIPLIS
jgi:hypothetical protein